jgi:hypothetical protein
MTGTIIVQAAHRCVPPPAVVLMSGDPAIRGYATVARAAGWFRKGDPLVRLLSEITRVREAQP